MKFKNIKKEKTVYHKSQKPKKVNSSNPKYSINFFPKIYRFITESHIVRLKWQKRQFWLNIVSILALLGFVVVSAHIYDNYKLSLEVQRVRKDYQEKLAQWEAVNNEFPGYRDGYLQAAVIAFQLGDKQKARNYTQKALNVDPNFMPTRQLAIFLGMSEKEEIQN